MFAHMFYIVDMTRKTKIPEICARALSSQMRPDLFKALCDPVRISIIATLAAKAEPLRVSDITDCCGIDFSGVSRHLKILKDAGILSAEKRGREMVYSLDAEDLAATLRAVADALVACRKAVA
jgi:ArsR family transcriptional regulator, arsenate/arsenite/antimonite-responsive transcriptional repressor